ncbi:MAG: DNA-binding response regulator [Anaerolineae bacterium]|nr:MAG: DNA-binding response regulator [Anaerolineae bacterium]
MKGALILIVDDEENIVNLVRMYLERDGFRVQAVHTGTDALQQIPVLRPALVVLDIMLPEMDGFTICRRLREQGNRVPILMLTARDEDVDKILGLELGADDYLTKPFNPRELVARIKAILRRGAPITAPEQSDPLYLADLVIDPAAREVRLQGQPLALRNQEFDLLWVLAQHHGMVLSRQKLLELAWGYDFYGQTRTVDVHVSHLRKKLAASQVRIETVSGVGYKLVS